MRRPVGSLMVFVLVLFGPGAAGATTTISVESGGITLNSTNTGTAGTEAVPWLINETMTGTGTLRFETDTAGDGAVGPDSTVPPKATGKWIGKTVTNNTGSTWTSFELELQVTLGIPSPDADGLSFAQDVGLVFTSDQFSAYTRIDTTRDYLNFHGGDVAHGESVTFNFAITDNQAHDIIFLLETPNKREVPEPATLALLGAGLALLGLGRRLWS